MGLVCLDVGGKYKDIVEIYGDELVQMITENRVHQSLECGRCIAEAEWHDHEFVQPPPTGEGRFEFVALCNADLVVARLQVYQAEHPRPG